VFLLYRNLNCGVLVLVGVVRVVRIDGICKCGFPVCGEFPISGCSVDGDVEEVYLAVCLLFCCEF
jgi:hypothetical protein